MENKALEHWLAARNIAENPDNMNDIIFHYEEALRLEGLNDLGKLTSHFRLGQLYHSNNDLYPAMKHFEILLNDDPNLSVIEEENERKALIDIFYISVSELYISLARIIKEKEGLDAAINFLENKIALLADKCPPMPYFELGGYYALDENIKIEKSEEMFKTGISAPSYNSEFQEFAVQYTRDLLKKNGSITTNASDEERTAEQWFENMWMLAEKDPDQCLRKIDNLSTVNEDWKRHPMIRFGRGIALLRKSVLIAPKNLEKQWGDASLDLIEQALTELYAACTHADGGPSLTEGKISEKFDGAACILEKYRPGKVQQLIGKTKLKYFGEDRVLINKGVAAHLIPSDDTIALHFANIFFSAPIAARLAAICYMTTDSNGRYIEVAFYENPSMDDDSKCEFIKIYDNGKVVTEESQAKPSTKEPAKPSKVTRKAIAVGVILIVLFIAWFTVRNWYGSGNHASSLNDASKAVEKYYSRYHIATDTDMNWDTFTFEQFVKPKRTKNPSFPFLVVGDFNGDGKNPDFACFIVNKAKPADKRLVIFHNGGPKPIDLGNVVPDGIDLVPKQKIKSDWKSIAGSIKGDGILVFKFESASGLLYWNGKKYSSYRITD